MYAIFLSGCVGVPKVADVGRVLSMDFLATSTNELSNKSLESYLKYLF